MIRKLLTGLGLIALVLVAVYLYFSQPQTTIDRLYNPDGVHNLHLIDSDPETGFAIYRMGVPDEDDMRGLCNLGITQMVILAGSADEAELVHRDACPSLQVMYNVQHLEGTGYSDQFLAGFDAWVEKARAEGTKIVFRCTCGCHRTGKLAAYYQMKYRGFSPKDAWDLSVARGRLMHVVDNVGGLQQQVLGLYDHIHDLPCEQGEYCVQSAPPQASCADPLLSCGWGDDIVAAMNTAGAPSAAL